jgi:DNA-binding transcriptional regulator LsrR (DeoR family)
MGVVTKRRQAGGEGDEEGVIPVVDREEQLLVRAAWLSYVGGLTQAQIAKRLGLNRIRVNRMLAQARDQGIVQIRINAKIADCVALEEALAARYGLRQAVVVPTPPDPALVPRAVAMAAGEALSSHVRPGMAIGVGWGRTLRLSLKSLAVRPMKGLSVVSLLGGLTRGSALNVYELASQLADLYAAECFYVAAPIYTDSEASRDLLLRQPILEDAFAHARKVDLAFVSVGGINADATNVRLGLLEPGDLSVLRRSGAVGDICAHWIDENGVPVDHPLNRRVIALPPQDLAAIDTVIMASGGREKVMALRAALRLGIVDVLVTDESAAKGILARDG